MHIIGKDEGGPASYVAEHSPTSGMTVHYIRYANGNISVYGLRDYDSKDQTSTVAIVTKENDVYIRNSYINGEHVENDRAKELAAGIRQLVDGAFPENAKEIVPLQNRESFDLTYILALSGLTKDTISNPRDNAAATDTSKAVNNNYRIVQGNGYVVVSIDGGYFLSKVDAQGNIILNLGVIPESAERTGHIFYDDANVNDASEPPVDDPLNTVPLADSKANARLAEKILAGGKIGKEEANNIRAALERAEQATQKQRESGVGILDTDKPFRHTVNGKTILQGNGYRIISENGYAVIEKINANGTVTEGLTVLSGSNSNEGAIQYDDPKVIDALEPLVLDRENNTAGSTSEANIALIGKILKDGVIDAKEATEIGAALDRGRIATDAELKKTGKAI